MSKPHARTFTDHDNPASILDKSIAGRYRPVSYPDGPITARYRFVKYAYWEKGLQIFKLIGIKL